MISSRNQKRMRPTAARAFTLTEAMIAMVVLGIAAAGVLLPFTGGAAARAEGVRRTLAAKLAADLMEEILLTPFSEILSTYDGYNEPQGLVKDAGGTVFSDPSYANFAREAACQHVYVPQESGTGEAVFIRAAVRVYYKGRQIAVINRLISK